MSSSTTRLARRKSDSPMWHNAQTRLDMDLLEQTLSNATRQQGSKAMHNTACERDRAGHGESKWQQNGEPDVLCGKSLLTPC